MPVHSLAFVMLLGSTFAFTACAAPNRAATEASVPFRVVETFDAPGDAITIEEVRCDRPRQEVGATLRVRGRCTLASTRHAQLYFGLTNGECTTSPLVDLVPGENPFDLTLHVERAGQPHVSMYAGPVVNGANCIGKRRFEILGR